MFYKMIEAKRDIWLQSDECSWLISSEEVV